MKNNLSVVTRPSDAERYLSDRLRHSSTTERKDYFIERGNVRFAGTHLIVDFWGASGLDDLALADRSLRDAAAASGATLLHVHLHHFTPNGGISGVAVLAESHISIHTWPECGYAALDVFMCGDCDPHKAVGVLREAFAPARCVVGEHRRGERVIAAAE